MSQRRSRTTVKYYSNFDEPYSKSLLQQLREKEEIEFGSKKDLVREKLLSIAKSGKQGDIFCRLWVNFHAIEKVIYDYNYLSSCQNKFLVLLSKVGNDNINMLSKMIVQVFNDKQLDFENCLEESKGPLLTKLYTA